MAYKPNQYVQTLTADKTLDVDDEVLLCSTPSISNLTCPLSHKSGNSYQIRNTGTANLNLKGNGSKIDGSTVNRVLAPTDSVILTSDGVDWWTFTQE